MGRAILDRRVEQVEDITAYQGHTFVDVLDHWSVMAVPILRHDVPLGAITIGRPAMGPFSDSQVALLQTFAEQAVIAISSAETYRALQTRTIDIQESLEYQIATSNVLKVISRSTFLRALVKAVPYKIHTVLTDNGIHFTDPKGETWTPVEIRQMIACKELFRAHAFEYACALADIDHRLTKPKHPWTNGQVERMNRTIKDATVRRFHYDAHDQFSNHLADFVQAYNFAKRLKTLKGLTPYEFICKAWTNQPERFTLNPLHQMPGLNS